MEKGNIIEMYSESLSKYVSIIHEAVEGRYELTGYDLAVIEAALNELADLKILPNESKTVNRNENAEKFYCYKCDMELKQEINSHDLYCPECNK